MWNQARDRALRVTRRHLDTIAPAHLSRTIDLSRIVLIVGLVFLHYGMYPNVRASPFVGMSVNEFQIATFVNSFLLFFFFSVVPLLSVISGWLFFSFFDVGESDPAASLARRIGGRFKSLYVPLVVWNLVYLCGLWVLHEFSGGHALFSALNLNFDTATLEQYFNAVFAIRHRPLAFQFWFVRDLFLTVLLSPILWVLIKRAPYVSACVLLAAWLVNYDFEIFFRPDVVLFFYLGGLIRYKGVDVGIASRATNVLVVAYVALVTIRALAPHFVLESSPLIAGFTRGMRVVGVMACWGILLRLAATPLGAALSRWGPFAFFLHAAHFPLIAEVKLILWNLLPEVNDFWMVMHYLASVSVTIALCLGSGAFLARYLPGVFAVLNGGRVPVLMTDKVTRPSAAPE